MLIAAEAFRQLSPELKAQTYEVLKAHPDYDKWVNAYHTNSVIDLATYVVMRSSTWPDEIRRSGTQDDHGNWHFVDYPLRPPSFPFEPRPQPDDDILFGIAQCEKTLADTNAAAELRAVYMSYLVHLIGDLHQPLHCESLYTTAYPEGDRGGNDFYVKPDEHGIRLHGLWDGLLGGGANLRAQWKYAIAIDAKFPRQQLPELMKHKTPTEWSLESRELAIDKGYLRGELQGGTNAETARKLPEGYTKTAKAVAERQAALAGYRLADEIQTYLKLGKTVPLLPEITNLISETSLPAKISAGEAARYYDETMTVTGKVVEVSVRANVTILDLDRLYPNTPFTAVVFEQNFAQFGDLKRFKDHEVEINGDVIEYHNKPEIILETAGQIKIVDGK